MPNDNDKPEGTSAFLLGQLVEGQKAMNEKLDAFINTSQKADKDHEDRLSSLEASRYKTVGAAGVLSLIASAIGAWWSGK
jgi:hypothetical protein